MKWSSLIGLLVGSAYANPETPLHVNTSEEHYSIEKDKISGEKDLLELTKTAPFEEYWIYVEHKDGRKIWHEVGTNEDFYITRVDIPHTDTVLGNLEDVVRVSEYHIHPLVESGDLVMLNYPSDLDQISTQFRSLSFREIEYSGNVVTPHGIYTMHVKPIYSESCANLLKDYVFSQEDVDQVVKDHDDMVKKAGEFVDFANQLKGNITFSFVDGSQISPEIF
jgi:hypothetical protein